MDATGLMCFGKGLAAAAAFLTAGFMAVRDKDGWGWLVLAGILCAG